MRRIAPFLFALSLPVLLPAAGLSAWLEPTQDGLAVTDWTLGRVTATGAGRMPAEGSMGQRRAMAVRAATTDAYRHLTAVVHGIKVTTDQRVDDVSRLDGVLKRKVEGVITGAQLRDTRYLPDYSVEVDLMMPIYGPNQLFAAVALEGLMKRRTGALPPPILGMPLWLGQAATFSGLIIDCGGLGMSAGMSPVIRQEGGGELYPGTVKLDADYVVNEGVVGYAHGVAEARTHQQRVGGNPLVVKAKDAAGQFRLDVVLDGEAAQQILAADAASRFLAQSKVVFAL